MSWGRWHLARTQDIGADEVGLEPVALVPLESAVVVLDRRRWELVVAQERPQPVAGTGSAP